RWVLSLRDITGLPDRGRHHARATEFTTNEFRRMTAPASRFHGKRTTRRISIRRKTAPVRDGISPCDLVRSRSVPFYLLEGPSCVDDRHHLVPLRVRVRRIDDEPVLILRLHRAIADRAGLTVGVYRRAVQPVSFRAHRDPLLDLE